MKTNCRIIYRKDEIIEGVTLDTIVIDGLKDDHWYWHGFSFTAAERTDEKYAPYIRLAELVQG